MKRIIYSGLIALLIWIGKSPLSAQTEGYTFGGVVMSQAAITPAQMAQLSQTQPLGSARTMSMAGAFASLGGDVGSITINPAGLGMFRHNEFSLTPMITVSSSKNSQPAYSSNSMTRFTPANFSFVCNVFEGSKSLVSVNLGLAYNRIADLNYRTSFQYDHPYNGSTASPSILHVMAGQLTTNQLYPDESGFLGYYGDRYPDLWGAMLAYNNYLINPYRDNEGDYWEADHVGHNALVGHFYETESRGSIGEWDLSAGLNIGNILYIGATLGVQQLSQTIETYYAEDFLYQDNSGQPIPAVNIDGLELIEQVDYFHYNQRVRMSGMGFNGKFGIILRPIAPLRIGVAVHTPTIYTIDHAYNASMAAVCYNNEEERYYSDHLDSDGRWEDVGPDAWRFTGPTRLMAGLSYTFGSRAVISVDYQRDWYNGIRTKQYPWWIPNTADYSKTEFQKRLAATNTVRAGLEIKPMERLALRAGAGFCSSQIGERELCEDLPLADRMVWYSGGIGFAFTHSFSLDLAYQYHRTENSSYRLFYAAYTSQSGERQIFDAAEKVTTNQIRHHIALTMNFRF